MVGAEVDERSTLNPSRGGCKTAEVMQLVASIGMSDVDKSIAFALQGVLKGQEYTTPIAVH